VAFDLLELDKRDLRAGPYGSGAIDCGSPMARAAGRDCELMGVRDKPIVPASPWHLRRVLKSYARYYNTSRTHRSLDKDAPVSRPVSPIRNRFVPILSACSVKDSLMRRSTHDCRR